MELQSEVETEPEVEIPAEIEITVLQSDKEVLGPTRQKAAGTSVKQTDSVSLSMPGERPEILLELPLPARRKLTESPQISQNPTLHTQIKSNQIK